MALCYGWVFYSLLLGARTPSFHKKLRKMGSIRKIQLKLSMLKRHQSWKYFKRFVINMKLNKTITDFVSFWPCGPFAMIIKAEPFQKYPRNSKYVKIMILQLNQLIHQLRQEKITLLFVKAGGEKKITTRRS